MACSSAVRTLRGRGGAPCRGLGLALASAPREDAVTDGGPALRKDGFTLARLSSGASSGAAAAGGGAGACSGMEDRSHASGSHGAGSASCTQLARPGADSLSAASSRAT